MTYQDVIRVEDSKGFIYEVVLKHQPRLGFSTAYYKGTPFETIDADYSLHEPNGDSDSLWEEYAERYGEWCDQIKDSAKRQCVRYLDNL